MRKTLVEFCLSVFVLAVMARGAYSCPKGIAGVSNSGSTICVADQAGNTWCDLAESDGSFNISGASVEPSTSFGCIPVSGNVQIYNIDCPERGRTVNRSDPAENLGGPDLDISCGGCTPVPDGLVAWWSFDELTLPFASDNASTYNAFGVHRNGPVATAGMVEGGLCFDGISQYVEVANNVDVDMFGECEDENADAESFTIDLWVRTSGTRLQTILDKRSSGDESLSGYHVYLLGDGRLGFQMASGVGNQLCNSEGSSCDNYSYQPSPDNVVINDGNWHFVAVSVSRCDPAQAFLYVDGQVVHTFEPRLGDISSAAFLQIGRRDPAFGAADLNGCVDELEIFKRALSESELDAIFRAGGFGKCKSCERSSVATVVPIVFPQLAIGGGFTSRMVVSNHSKHPWHGVGSPKQGQAEQWATAWTLNGEDHSGTSGFSVDLAPYASASFQIGGDQEARSGYLELAPTEGSSRHDVVASFLYELRGESGQLLDSTATPPSPSGKGFLIPIEADSGALTGFAIAPNGDAGAFDIKLTLFDEQGNRRGERDLRARGHRAAFLSEYFEEIEDGFVGSVRLESLTPFRLTVLRLESQGEAFQLTSIPAAAIP